jgi:hypothetical protein
MPKNQFVILHGNHHPCLVETAIARLHPVMQAGKVPFILWFP